MLVLCDLEISSGQDTTTRYHYIGPGFSMAKMIDEGISPLRYKGPAASVNGGFHFRKPDQIKHLDVVFEYGELSNNANNSTITHIMTDVDLKWLKTINLGAEGKIKWMAGGIWSNNWTFWLHNNYSNNAYNNNFYSNLGPALGANYNFRLFERDFSLRSTAFLPVLNFIVRPAFSNSRFKGFLDQQDDEKDVFAFLQSGEFATIPNYFRLKTLFALEYYIKNNNGLRLSYSWDYYGFDNYNNLKGGTHNLSFAILLNF